MSVIEEAVEGIFSVVSGDIPAIRIAARGRTVSDWKTAQLSKAVIVGAGSAAIPIAGYLTLPADLAALMRLMHRTTIGICEIDLKYADDDTFASVLSVWAGAVKLNDELAERVSALALAQGASTIGGKVGLKMAIKSFTLCAHAIVAKKLGPKVATKVAAKLSAKLAAKATTRWIPFVSAGVGGYLNWWIIDSLGSSAQEYTAFIKQVSS
jgi:hypothetical protein